MDGFLGTRASLMLDVVFLAMFAVLPLMGWAIWLAKQRRFALHKRVQLTLAVVLLATVTLFELDIRWHGWRQRATASPYYGTVSNGTETTWGWVDRVLAVHLCFAVSTSVLWILVVTRALRSFPAPPAPGSHSRWHRRWAKLAALDMTATSLTGWVFYYLAFVA